MMSPIIILASERSGTNLLRSLLDNHSNICAPPPPHIYMIFYPLRGHYRDLRVVSNVERLAKDILHFVNLPYNNWELGATYNDILSAYNPKSFQACVHSIWHEQAARSGKVSFASKDIESFHFANEIRSYSPDARFLYLVRDPRDVVASWMKNPIVHWTPYNVVKKWISDQEVCLDLIKTQGLIAPNIFYEKLIENTEDTMSDVLRELNETIDEACFVIDEGKAKKLNFNPLWENLSRPIMRDNSQKYLTILSDEEIEMIETLCKPLMDEFGYEPISDCKWVRPKRFGLDNDRRANRKKVEMDKWMQVNMPLLVEKHEQIAMLKERLRSDYPIYSSEVCARSNNGQNILGGLRDKIASIFGGVL